MERVISVIDFVNEWIGRIASWIVLILIGILVYESTARYAFDAPTQWGYDTAYMLYGAMFMLGISYALKNGGHVRIDVFSRLFSVRALAFIDIFAFACVVIPVAIMLMMHGWDYAIYSYQIQEVSGSSAWRPLMWPFKMVVPIAAFLLVFQSISEILKQVIKYQEWARSEAAGKKSMSEKEA